MQVKAWMLFEPALYGGGLMCGVVVSNQMQVKTGRGLLINLPEKTEELLRPVTRQAAADDLAIEHVQRCKQRSRSIALVVVRHRSAAALFHRQAGLGTVERLDLAFFVNAQNQRLVWRIKIKPDHVLDFGGEVLVARDLERLDPVRLEPVRVPDPLHAAVRDLGHLRHAAQAPVGRIRRLAVQRHLHHLLDYFRAERFDARRTGRVLQKSLNPFGDIAPAPAPDRQQALADLRRNRLRRQTIPRQQHDPSPPNNFLRRVAVSHQPLQPLTVGAAQQNPVDLSHRQRLADPCPFVNPTSATKH